MSDQNPSCPLSKPPHKLVTKSKTTKRSPGKSKNKNTNNIIKPLKVVYISNPMKYNVPADEFRTLVQGLTGRDAEWPEDYDCNHVPAPADDATYTGAADDHQGELVQVQHEEYTLEMDQQPMSSFGSSELSYDCFGHFGVDVGAHHEEQMVLMEDFHAFVGHN